MRTTASPLALFERADEARLTAARSPLHSRRQGPQPDSVTSMVRLPALGRSGPVRSCHACSLPSSPRLPVPPSATVTVPELLVQPVDGVGAGAAQAVAAIDEQPQRDRGAVDGHLP